MKLKEFYKARELRAKGFSLQEIAMRLGVAKSSVSAWVRNLVLSSTAKRQLSIKTKAGPLTAARNKIAQTKAKEHSYLEEAKRAIFLLKNLKDYHQLFCAVMYWCEGAKNPYYGIAFINSDPDLMKSFIKFFRSSFVIDESKFKPLLHLHQYHDQKLEIDFWSKITNIKSSQFKRPYIKPHTGKRIRENYHGCLSLRYYNADMARRLLALGKAFLNKGA